MVADRIQQVLDELDVVGVDGVSGIDPTLGIGLDGQQFVRINTRDIAAARQRRPQRSQHAGGEHAIAQLFEKMPLAVIEIIFPDMHFSLPRN